MILLSVLMLVFVAVKKWPHFGLCSLSKKYMNYPAFFGFLKGINVCPPFLLAMSAALSYASIAGSILLFGGFLLEPHFISCYWCRWVSQLKSKASGRSG